MDDVGAEVKHYVFMAILRKGIIVRNVIDLVTVARETYKNVKSTFQVCSCSSREKVGDLPNQGGS